MEPTLGYKGLVCPVTNCYMRHEKTGACAAGKNDAAKASSKLMRDTMTIVDIINAARDAPEWAKFTVITNLDERYDDFIKEAELNPNKLQYVLDHNQLYAATMASVFKSQV